jgi:hypothetical protein
MYQSWWLKWSKVPKIKEFYHFLKMARRETTTLGTLDTLSNSFFVLSIFTFKKKGRHSAAALMILWVLSNRGRLTKMFLLDCHASATTANILHRCQFVFTQVGVIRFRSAAETAIGFITAGITQVTGFVGDRSTIFTGICHC